MKNGLLKLMNIRPEEFKPVMMLIGFSFLTGLSMSFYFTASNAIFLQQFNPKIIPVSFIASGVLIYLAWLLFSVTDRRFNFASQVQAKMGFTFVTVLLISLGVLYYRQPWLVFIMYTWVRIVVYLTLVSFWGIAGKMFNIRQGKRIFGLIGIGEVVSIMIGYFSIPVILKVLKAADLLFLATGTLLLCFITARIILSVFKDQLSVSKNTPEPLKKTEKQSGKPETSYRKLIKQPYFLLMSAMALLPIFGYLFVDFLFLSQTKKQFENDPQTLANFLGIFLGFVAFVELILKLVSGRFLNKYGIKYSLIILPVILSGTILIGAFSGSLYGAAGLFFTLIVLARLFERSVRSAVYEPAFQLLYQPVPVTQRLIFQNQIEGIPKALGTVITGLAIVIFSAFPLFNLVHYSYFYLLALCLWIWVAYKMYNSYRSTIKSKLVEADTKLAEQKTQTRLQIPEFLKIAQPFEFERTYRICHMTDPYVTEQALKTAEFDEGWMVGKEIISGYLPEPVILSNEEILKLCHSAEINDRLLAAKLLSTSARYSTVKMLHILAKDANIQIRRQTLIAAGNVKRHELWPFIMECFADNALADLAMRTARQIGEPIMKDLNQLFDKPTTSFAVRKNIIRTWELCSTPVTIKLLARRLDYPDKEVQKQVVIALSNRQYKPSASELPVLKNLLEDNVKYLTWLIASLHDLAEESMSFELKLSLLSEEEFLKEYLFKILALIYDENSIDNIRRNIENKDANMRIYAMEIADMTMSAEIKEIFIPIFEDLTLSEKLQKLRFRFPQPEYSVYERCLEIINSAYWNSNRYTKACALKLLVNADTLSHSDIVTTLAAFMAHPDRLLCESAASSLRQFDEDYYRQTIERLSKKGLPNIKLSAKQPDSLNGDGSLMLLDMISFMKQSDYFAAFDESVLLELLDMFPEIGIVDKHSNSNGREQSYNNAIEYISIGEGRSMVIPSVALYSFMMDKPEHGYKIFKTNGMLQSVTHHEKVKS